LRWLNQFVALRESGDFGFSEKVEIDKLENDLLAIERVADKN